MSVQAKRPETPGKPQTQKEAIAALYNQKAEALARASVEREGRPYGKTTVDLDRLAALWDEQAPDVDEAKVWEREMNKIVEALAADPTLDKDELLEELPIVVGTTVYPNRKRVLQDMGGLTYDDWARDAELVEAHAAKLREKRAKEAPPLEPVVGEQEPDYLTQEVSASMEPPVPADEPPPAPQVVVTPAIVPTSMMSPAGAPVAPGIGGV